MGAFATRPITYGDVILSEAPLFTQTLVQCGVRTIALALSSKSDSEKRQYLELANCHQGRYPPLMGIFRTNALPCGDNGTRKIATKAGIFLKATRFNSSCVPNVNNWWNEGKNVIEFRALRDIAQGEELSITYAVDLSPWADRRRELQVRYGFECHCEACSLSGEALTASDDRRIKLESLIDEIGECGNRPAEGIRKVRTLCVFCSKRRRDTEIHMIQGNNGSAAFARRGSRTIHRDLLLRCIPVLRCGF